MCLQAPSNRGHLSVQPGLYILVKNASYEGFLLEMNLAKGGLIQYLSISNKQQNDATMHSLVWGSLTPVDYCSSNTNPACPPTISHEQSHAVSNSAPLAKYPSHHSNSRLISCQVKKIIKLKLMK